MDGIAGEGRPLYLQFHFEEGKARVLHGGLGQQTLGKAIRKGAGSHPSLNVRFLAQKFQVGEEHFHQARGVDEVCDVRLGDGSANGLEGRSDRQILEKHSQADGPHNSSPSLNPK